MRRGSTVNYDRIELRVTAAVVRALYAALKSFIGEPCQLYGNRDCEYASATPEQMCRGCAARAALSLARGERE